ncbi:MAG: hypothetical protein V1928_02925 [Parcubacteria group bacterium]
MVKFGDIFRYKEYIYIYLAAKDDGVTLYVSQIFSNREVIQDFIKSRSGLSVIKTIDPVKKNILDLSHCFIILTTDGFESQMAHLANSDKHNVNITESESIGELCREDLNALKKEILDNIDVLPPTVVKYVQELDIERIG